MASDDLELPRGHQRLRRVLQVVILDAIHAVTSALFQAGTAGLSGEASDDR